MKYEIKNRSFSETLTDTFLLYKDNFRTLFFIALVNSIPGVFMPDPGQGDPAKMTPIQVLNEMKPFITWYFAFGFVSTIAIALMTQYIARRFQDREANILPALKRIPFFIIPVTGAYIMEALLVGLMFFPIFIPYIVPALFPASLPILLGAIYLLIAFSLITQVIIVERAGFISACKRSMFLTKGFKGLILGYGIVFFLIIIFGASIGQSIGELLLKSGANAAFALLVQHLIQVLFYPVSSCFFLLIYFSMRIRKGEIVLRPPE